MKSSRPGSAQWRSSKTMTTGACRRDALEERPPGREQLLAPRSAPARRPAARGARARSSGARSSSGTYSATDRGDLLRGSSPRRRSRAGRRGRGPSRPAPRSVMPVAVGRASGPRASRPARPGRRCTSGTPRRGGSCRSRPGPMTDDEPRPPLARGRVEQVLEQAQLRRRGRRTAPRASRSGRARRARRRRAARARPGPGSPCP